MLAELHRWLLYGAFGWLAATGLLQFVIDVVAQWARGKRPPSPETTLYYGLNASFCLGQVTTGALCCWLVGRAPALLDEWPVRALTFFAAIGWLLLTFGLMEYREPRINAAIFAALLLAACVIP